MSPLAQSSGKGGKEFRFNGNIGINYTWRGADSKIDEIKVSDRTAYKGLLAFLESVGGSGSLIRFIADKNGSVFEDGVEKHGVPFISVSRDVIKNEEAA